MPPASVSYKSKQSQLLTAEENQQIFRLLGQRCQSLATTVIQLYETHPPTHTQWMKKDAGVLCFVRDNQRKNYFFRLYCLKRNKMIGEQELYNNMEYIAPHAYMHTFEGDESMICFNFANEEEAKELKIIVDAKLFAKRKREARKSRSNNTQQQQDEVQLKNNKNTNNMQVITKNIDPIAKKAKRRRNITKADIGKPLEFRHISHVGWDPNRGFDVSSEDAALNDFFEKAGVSESHLKDKETRQFIYDFIAANGGRDAVIEQESKAKRPPPAIPITTTTITTTNSGPPVPPRGSTRAGHNRAAPPPPPTTIVNQPPPRPPPVSRSNINNNNATSIPPPPLPTMENNVISSSACVIVSSPPPSLPPNNDFIDNRSALLESIREGTNLKPVEKEQRCDDAREGLLSEIRKGFQLKPANEREVKHISPAVEQVNCGNDLAAALSRALAERNRVIHPDDDDDTESSDSNDDEWDA